ncbi:NDR1/HIN1-like protein 13 isoform X2 [Impatiens glandulifera]|uniref:NDR1/HIN1-like protein 13 isoform X2 n=1 Tax=Impatiens glandulifera TaxID=253017 RepID=UPI001FB0BAE7|nr:NDR1/HIN1-like protein 13 isoform X2 [Impatiens glandulifera]
MTDRVYPSKANGAAATNGTTAANGTAAANIPRAFPATKSQFNNPNRHPYRPTPNTYRSRRGRRGCFCLCCFWSILILLILLLLAAIAGCVFYVLYSPHRPSFSVNALRISQFNLTTAADDTTHLAAAVNLSISAKNPNKKLIFFYDLISITAQTSNNVVISNGSFPNFPSYTGNTTIIRSVLSTASSSEFVVVDADSVASLRSDLTKKSGLPLKIVMDTKVVVKMDAIKSKKIGIRITCDGIHGVVPKGNTTEVASTADSNCKVDLRIKIWKWTF